MNILNGLQFCLEEPDYLGFTTKMLFLPSAPPLLQQSSPPKHHPYYYLWHRGMVESCYLPQLRVTLD